MATHIRISPQVDITIDLTKHPQCGYLGSKGTYRGNIMRRTQQIYLLKPRKYIDSGLVDWTQTQLSTKLSGASSGRHCG